MMSFLEKREFPLPNELFSLPNAIWFLMEFRSDLKHLHGKNLSNRLALYFWWESFGSHDYPDFKWELSQVESDFISEITPNDFLSKYSLGTFYWLQGKKISVLKNTRLATDLLHNLKIDDLQFKINIPLFFQVIYENRVDLRSQLDLKTLLGVTQFVLWWDRVGNEEFPRIKWDSNTFWAYLNEDINFHADINFNFPRIFKLLSLYREDLKVFGILNFVKWWDRVGNAEFPRIKWDSNTFWAYLNENINFHDDINFNFPRIFKLLSLYREDLKVFGILNFVKWWNDYGSKEYPLINWSSNFFWDYLSQQENQSNDKLPRLFYLMVNEREDLNRIFDLNTEKGRESFFEWWNTFGHHEYPDFYYDFLKYKSQKNNKKINGINVIGFPQGILGLGEDARMATTLIHNLQIPVVAINAPMSGPAKRDHTIDQFLHKRLVFDTSLFCLPPVDMYRLLLEGGRHLIENDTYKIGAWPWELPNLPISVAPVLEYIDEIWAQSKFVESALKKQNFKNVHLMPMVVTIPTPQIVVRANFGLDDEVFIFYILFDGNSWLNRKNPLSAVLAFQIAFPTESQNNQINLVIKAINVDEKDLNWLKISQIAKEDTRIKIILKTMDRQELINLMSICNCYISLHRSEGFGRVIAEAMLLGQPVVVSNFSGNIDFCNVKTSYLVEGELIPLKPNDYLYYEGQYWFEPNLTDAADQFRKVYFDETERKLIASNGKNWIEKYYSFEAVGKAYKKRLSKIFKERRSCEL